MDYRGNMSSQHRRSKINHSVIMGPELTQRQQNFVKKSRSGKLTDLTSAEILEWIEICQLHEEYWKNRRSYRRSWQASLERAQQELTKRQDGVDLLND